MNIEVTGRRFTPDDSSYRNLDAELLTPCLPKEDDHMDGQSIHARCDAFWGWDRWDPRRLWVARFTCGTTLAISSRRLLAWRTVVALYIFCAGAWLVYDQPNSYGFYASYLTIQGMWLTICYFVSASVLGAVTWYAPSAGAKALASDSKSLIELAYLGWVRATQILFELAVCYQLVIVVLYWILLAGDHPTSLSWWRWVIGNAAMHR